MKNHKLLTFTIILIILKIFKIISFSWLLILFPMGLLMILAISLVILMLCNRKIYNKIENWVKLKEDATSNHSN